MHTRWLEGFAYSLGGVCGHRAALPQQHAVERGHARMACAPWEPSLHAA